MLEVYIKQHFKKTVENNHQTTKQKQVRQTEQHNSANNN